MQTSTASKIVLLLLVAAITVLFVGMIRPFLMAVLLAGIFTSLARPLYLRLRRCCRGRSAPAALTTLLVIVLLIIIPLGSLLGIVTAQALRVGESISPWVQDKIQHPDQIVTWLEGLPFYDRLAPYRDDLLTRAGQAVSQLSRFLIGNLSAATSGTVQFLFMLSLMLYSMYFFLIDGERLLDRFRSVTRATLKGTAVIGLLQGTLAGLALAVVGVPSAVFWGTIMVVLSIIPGIGTGLVWLPAAIILAAGGHWAQGIGLAVFCGLVVGSVDNFLRPRLVGQDTKLPDLLILLGTMGGILMFGILGFIVGPIVAALFVTVWEIYGAAFGDVLPPGRPRPTPEPAAEPEAAADS